MSIEHSTIWSWRGEVRATSPPTVQPLALLGPGVVVLGPPRVEDRTLGTEREERDLG